MRQVTVTESEYRKRLQSKNADGASSGLVGKWMLEPVR